MGSKFIKILTLVAVGGLLSGCLRSGGGQYADSNPYRPTYQSQYQQSDYQGYQQNSQGTLQNPFNVGTLQNPLNQSGGQGTFGRRLQTQVQNKEPSLPPGYSDSGYQPGYPSVTKPSFQGWSDPDKAAGIW